ncbi:hypothetical protein ROHU_022989 [Labeo rohita]|uniref:Uncharacterized protein n=1 Tax=Labeo rohita TaxID=84645 RepID=A0A498MUS5_LABRO|nr:hypothetical protein ROHU_022989 [Labeo rohita]
MESPPCKYVSGGGPPLRPKGAAALLRREGEPRPLLSMQHNSNSGQRAHTVTRGSHGSATLGGGSLFDAG